MIARTHGATLHQIAVKSIAKTFYSTFCVTDGKALHRAVRMSDAANADAPDALDIPYDVLRALGCWIDITRDADALVRKVT